MLDQAQESSQKECQVREGEISSSHSPGGSKSGLLTQQVMSSSPTSRRGRQVQPMWQQDQPGINLTELTLQALGAALVAAVLPEDFLISSQLHGSSLGFTSLLEKALVGVGLLGNRPWGSRRT